MSGLFAGGSHTEVLPALAGQALCEQGAGGQGYQTGVGETGGDSQED